MQLKLDEQQNVNNIRSLKNGHNPETLRDTQIGNLVKYYVDNIEFISKPCKACEGTGLANFSRHTDGCSTWDCTSFCEECNGVGFIDWEIKNLVHACPDCNGTGQTFIEMYGRQKCAKCDGKGFLDWIQYAKGCL